MVRILILCFGLFFGFNSFSQTIFIVRHAEKQSPGANMSSDVELSEAGKDRAEALLGLMKKEKIAVVYSTNTIRTKSTGQPTANYFGLEIQAYGPRPDSAFAAMLRASGKNTLVIAHSNTIDDVVNLIMGETKVPADLDEKIYDNLYVVRMEGDKWVFENRKYGALTN